MSLLAIDSPHNRRLTARRLRINRSRKWEIVMRPMRAASQLAKALCVTAATSIGALTTTQIASAGDIPTFAVDPSWPKPLPNNWIIGQIGGITVDWQGHIWVIQRPRSLTDAEKGATLNPPRSKCCVPAPPVLEFDVDGNLLQSWGGLAEAMNGSGASMASKSTNAALSGSAAMPTMTARF
jgi:hypothetical protein